MMDINKDINKRYAAVKQLNDIDGKDIRSIQEMLDIDDYIIFLCHKLEKWLGVDKINKVVTYFSEICTVMSINNVKTEDLPESCQVIVTSAKYYVKGVYATKRVYNI